VRGRTNRKKKKEKKRNRQKQRRTKKKKKKKRKRGGGGGGGGGGVVVVGLADRKLRRGRPPNSCERMKGKGGIYYDDENPGQEKRGRGGGGEA
jgi:hypothetical protein